MARKPTLPKMWRPAGMAGTGLAALAAVITAAPPATPKSPTFETAVAPNIAKFCGKCHGANPIAGVNLISDKTVTAALTRREHWAKVLENVRSGHMPPKGLPAPTTAERARMVAALETTLSGDCSLADAGRVTLRRLNREEYDNSVRDLIGVDLRYAHENFPSDDVGYGFDNIGDVLSLSPLLMEKYLDAAERISEAAISLPAKRSFKLAGGDFPDVPGAGGDAEKLFSSNGETSLDVTIPKAGLYKLKVVARGQLAGTEPPKLRVSAGERSETFYVGNLTMTSYELPFKVASGEDKVKVTIAFLNDFYDPNAPDDRKDRNIVMSHVEVLGPLGGDGSKALSHRRLIPVEPVAGQEDVTARSYLAQFAAKAWRRPLKPGEAERFDPIIAFGKRTKLSFEGTMRLGVQAILVSPNFIFRVETDPTAKARNLNTYELASRMSYFLWSSTPDDALRAAAADGSILKPAVQAAQVRRMLLDPKSRALADNFAGQWLQLRKLESFTADAEQFPMWNNGLREAMTTETKLFFKDVVRNDRPVTTFLDGKFTYVNDELAKLYGIPGDFGPEFRRVALPASGPRGGLLTQGSVLAVTSNPTRTSPVKRGKWVLEALLGTPPPPPPPGVGDLGDDKKILTAASLRKRLEEHRKNAVCASCHKRMDPIGFGMENFDAIGRWREKQDGQPIDTGGVLPDGRKFSGPVELRSILVGKRDMFLISLAEKMLTYGTGRGVDSADRCHLDTIVKETRGQGDRFSALVAAVVKSDPFRKRGSAAKAK